MPIRAGKEASQGWMTPNEAAEYLRMSRARLYRHFSDGRIPGYRMFGEGALRFKREDLDALMVPVEAGAMGEEEDE